MKAERKVYQTIQYFQNNFYSLQFYFSIYSTLSKSIEKIWVKTHANISQPETFPMYLLAQVINTLCIQLMYKHMISIILDCFMWSVFAWEPDILYSGPSLG